MPEAFAAPSDADARIAALEASLARANAALAARDLLIDTLRGQIARLRRMQFGASSEKLSREIAQLELALEELETESAVPDVEAAAPNTLAKPAPVRSLPDHLPRDEVVHEPASGACTCPDCGGTLRRLGADTHEMLDVMPVRWRVVRQVRPKYSCRRPREDRPGAGASQRRGTRQGDVRDAGTRRRRQVRPPSAAVPAGGDDGGARPRDRPLDAGGLDGTGSGVARPRRQSHPRRGATGRQDPRR